MIAIVTDSTAYLTRHEARQLGVFIAPMSYTVDGRQYHEVYADCNGAYEELIRNGGDLKTSQTTMTVFMSTFEELLAKGYDVLCITISSRLSGTYSSASMAARNTDPDRVRLVDSLSTAGGLRYLVQAATRMIDKGMELDAVVERLQRLRSRVGIVFSVSDMGPLRRSGRLGVVRQSVGTILNVRPLLGCVDGSVVAVGTARGRYEQIRKMAQAVPQQAARLTVHHINEEKTAQLIHQELKKGWPAAEISLRPLGPILGIHLGLGTLGIVWECPPDAG
ncbi:MAG: DegV family protein [Eubacteriales bacterium]|nr:DegV family protein [Eubacteriales bacterium]